MATQDNSSSLKRPSLQLSLFHISSTSIIHLRFFVIVSSIIKRPIKDLFSYTLPFKLHLTIQLTYTIHPMARSITQPNGIGNEAIKILSTWGQDTSAVAITLQLVCVFRILQLD